MSSQKGNSAIVASIIVAGAIIAGAIIFGNASENRNVAAGNNVPTPSAHGQMQGNSSAIREISEDDHIFGNVAAAATIIEYSDFECPFCGRLHPTLERITEERDDVKWVYRHFPLSIHRNAQSAAVASECVADLAGNDAFWEFADSLFDNQRSLGQELYTQAASQLGISGQELQSCINSGKFDSEVKNDLDEAIAAGGTGTPFSVLITPNGQAIPFSGALPYERVISLINSNI